MTTMCCNLPVKNWSVSESYDCETESYSGSNIQVTLFGKIDDSDEGMLTGHTFQLCFKSEAKNNYEVKIYDDHVFIGIVWPLAELKNLESQINNHLVSVNFGIVLNFEEWFTFELPDNKKCQLISITKSIRNT